MDDRSEVVSVNAKVTVTESAKESGSGSGSGVTMMRLMIEMPLHYAVMAMVAMMMLLREKPHRIGEVANAAQQPRH